MRDDEVRRTIQLPVGKERPKLPPGIKLESEGDKCEVMDKPLLKRYSIDTWFLHGSSVYNTRQDEEGEWCKATDTLAIATDLATAQAEIERLKAELAETWQPVADATGKLHGMWGQWSADGDKINVEDSVGYFRLDLGKYRLCQKTVMLYLTTPPLPLDFSDKQWAQDKAREMGFTPVEAEPVVVDWEKYGEEWQWFAVDTDGEGYAFENCPYALDHVWVDGANKSVLVGHFNLNSTDWRETLTERPDQPKGVTRV